MGFETTTEFDIVKKDNKIYTDFSIVPTAMGFKINDNVSLGRSVISTMFESRTTQEKLAWKAYIASNLPSYKQLCLKEYEAIVKGFGNIGTPILQSLISILLVLLGFGHIGTEIGRRAMYCMCWKFMKFIQVSIGWWTNDMVKMYSVHETVHHMSPVWDDPFVKQATLSEGWAPHVIQYLTRSPFAVISFTMSLEGMGLYVPKFSMKRPSRGALESATTIL